MSDVYKECMYNVSKLSFISLCAFISFLVTYGIVFSMCQSLTLGIIAGIISGFIVSISIYIIIKGVEKGIEDRRIHKTDIVLDVLVKLRHTKINRDDFTSWNDKNGFKVRIKGLTKLKEKDVYEPAIKHLEAYPDTYRLWDDSIKKIYGNNGLNDKLKGLRTYLSREIRISNKFDVEEYVKFLHQRIWCIIENINTSEIIKNNEDLNKFLKNITITSNKNQVFVDYIYLGTKKALAEIPCKKVKVKDVLEFVSNLIKKDRVFREKIKSFTIGYKELENTFNNDFIKKLCRLLNNIRNREEKLKGKCVGCSRLVKYFGDC